VESDFEKIDGVVEAISGYTGGQKPNPTYKEVSAGGTGHAEAVQIRYDPDKVTYQELLDVFWRHVDPTDAGGQFVDRGSQYRPAIFYHDEEQKRLAEESKAQLEKSGRFSKPIATEIVPLSEFFSAEDYHQDYYKKSPLRYKLYRRGSGRDQFLQRTWGKEAKSKPSSTKSSDRPKYAKPADEVLKKKLSTNTGTTKRRVFTWTLFRGSRCLPRWTSLIREPAGPVSPGRLNPKTSSNTKIADFLWCAPRCAANMQTLIWGMSLRMGRHLPA
jgi:peptide methionine sulfoxide reductase msrA/msrB